MVGGILWRKERKWDTDSQRQVARVLWDDKEKFVTTFDMNKLASLTYGDSICTDVFVVLEEVLKKP
eukprot:CAMPEP_0198300426 /NCGR_PEP_ID=MMETSP1449-20131203/48186_1 /TAXON_ID=420275 /ORGANISM="Attheya septentrionalis, Strain CCMP2084" /LENGTH=65 /DNA_ID=CAMNT_0044002261 /DNA_START=137 /DNA_END=330 /DNA_ORIENTATION=+